MEKLASNGFVQRAARILLMLVLDELMIHVVRHVQRSDWVILRQVLGILSRSQ